MGLILIPPLLWVYYWNTYVHLLRIHFEYWEHTYINFLVWPYLYEVRYSAHQYFLHIAKGHILVSLLGNLKIRTVYKKQSKQSNKISVLKKMSKIGIQFYDLRVVKRGVLDHVNINYLVFCGSDVLWYELRLTFGNKLTV